MYQFNNFFFNIALILVLEAQEWLTFHYNICYRSAVSAHQDVSGCLQPPSTLGIDVLQFGEICRLFKEQTPRYDGALSTTKILKCVQGKFIC